MHVTFKTRVHKVWVHRVGHTNSSTRSWVHEGEYTSWTYKVDILSWSMNESVNESMNDIHINVYRHANIHKRIRDVGWVVEKTNAESLWCGVSGPVSPVHGRAFWPFSQKPACVLFGESPKGQESGLSTRPTSEVKQFRWPWLISGRQEKMFWTHGLLLRSALPLSVNLNCYATKVATHMKFLG